MKKKLGNNIISKSGHWSFSGKIVKKFDEHILQSIPFYLEIQELYLFLSDFFIQNNSRIIDIGCSTGSFLEKLVNRNKKNPKKIVFEGYDCVDEMILFCKKKKISNAKFFKKDLNKVDFNNSCLVMSFYTIQFIEPKFRQKLIDNIYSGLNWGGAFFFVEKTRGSDARFQDILNQIYIDYKLTRNFKPDEIINKSRSLKGLMEPFSHQGNIDMLKRAGFKDIETVVQYGPFKGFLCIK
jgi:tRNA (cmo5U34)-methyltransferase